MKELRFSVALLVLVIAASTASAHAQRAPLPLGSVQQVKRLASCGGGFFTGMTCFQAQMSCPNTANIEFTYGFEDPSETPTGTIVFLEGGNGTSVSEARTIFSDIWTVASASYKWPGSRHGKRQVQGLLPAL